MQGELRVGRNRSSSQDRAANQKFFAGEHLQFSKEAAQLLLEAGIIRQIPDLTKLADTRFIQ